MPEILSQPTPKPATATTATAQPVDKDSKEKLSTGVVAKKKCIFLVSMNAEEYFEGDKLKAILRYIKANYDKSILLLTDTLHRFNAAGLLDRTKVTQVYEQKDESKKEDWVRKYAEDKRIEAAEVGVNWMARNKRWCDEILGESHYIFLTWDQLTGLKPCATDFLKDFKFKDFFSEGEALVKRLTTAGIKKGAEFVEDMKKTVKQFKDRRREKMGVATFQLIENHFDYFSQAFLEEECAGMNVMNKCLVKAGYSDLVYPQSATNVLAFMIRYFKDNNAGKGLSWVHCRPKVKKAAPDFKKKENSLSVNGGNAVEVISPSSAASSLPLGAKSPAGSPGSSPLPSPHSSGSTTPPSPLSRGIGSVAAPLQSASTPPQKSNKLSSSMPSLPTPIAAPAKNKRSLDDIDLPLSRPNHFLGGHSFSANNVGENKEDRELTAAVTEGVARVLFDKFEPVIALSMMSNFALTIIEQRRLRLSTDDQHRKENKIKIDSKAETVATTNPQLTNSASKALHTVGLITKPKLALSTPNAAVTNVSTATATTQPSTSTTLTFSSIATSPSLSSS
jgi:hypothetical protein